MEYETNSSGASVSSSSLDPSRPSSSSKKQHFALPSSGFPQLLFALLEDAENDGNAHIVSWSADGLAFKVHQRDVFMKHILPNYFGLTKYNSFTRQLQLWGFAFCKGASNPKFGACKFPKQSPCSHCHHHVVEGLWCSHSTICFDFHIRFPPIFYTGSKFQLLVNDEANQDQRTRSSSGIEEQEHHEEPCGTPLDSCGVSLQNNVKKYVGNSASRMDVVL
jgi:hypothetical protein